jgi:hypothetical protein
MEDFKECFTPFNLEIPMSSVLQGVEERGAWLTFLNNMIEYFRIGRFQKHIYTENIDVLMQLRNSWLWEQS